ncbi:hypothetical protein F4808DRAFT_463990 [Astrocystis sublimbata]|nr:hypothetical protein F4808DRAFT_463990 [Astrocystis sublimbata]
MAELVSLVGGPGVLITLILKLSSGLLTLKNIIADIKEGPGELSILLREVEILEPTLETMRREINSNNQPLLKWDGAPALLSIDYCEKAILELHTVIGDVGQQLKSPRKFTRRRASIKTWIRKDFAARLQLHYWLASRLWEIQASRAQSGWTIKLHSHLTRPDSAAIFKYARKGDVTGVSKLLGLGEASLQDHITSGQSLLHIAAAYGHLDLYKFLLPHGFDPWEMDYESHMNPAETAIVCGLRRGMDAIAMYNFFVASDTYFNCLTLTSDVESYWYECMQVFTPRPSFSLVIGSVVPGFYELELEDRIKYGASAFADLHADNVRVLFDASYAIRDQDITRLQERGICFLSIVAFHYGSLVVSRPTPVAGEWRQLARETIGMTEDLCYQGCNLDATFQSRLFMNKGFKANPVLEFFQHNPPMTPLLTALSFFRFNTQERVPVACFRDLRKMMTTTLTWWLEDLKACGVDLIEYGRKERRKLLRSNKLRHAWYQCNCTRSQGSSHESENEDTARLVDLVYGADPWTWKLDLDMEPERFVGGFWDLVDNVPLHIPGSWPTL